MTGLPVIDVSGLGSIELSARDRVAAQLGHACREIGFFYVVHHGVAESTRAAIFAASREFFRLPAAAKEAYSIKRSQHNRGYVALEGERLNEGAAPADYKEAFNIGLELAADHPEVVAGKPFRGAGTPDPPRICSRSGARGGLLRGQTRRATGDAADAALPAAAAGSRPRSR
jgi:isopenicillin N synthase-like dioxygenase